MPLTPGTRLGRYEVVSLLGAGGMGEVYLAKDSQLERTVAIKVLTERLADKPELRQRFEREARAVSSLNHPHICTLHDVGCENGVHFLVMEHLEGETLVDRLRKGALPTEEALTYAIQIADALDKAHRQGVVHRDLKPGNIMLTRSGAKLLDFGLAKQTADTRPSLSSVAQTESSPLTAEGTVVGTFQYMSPEQLEGKEADSRTDLFSFGAVLFEMVTGKKAFEGKSQASLIAAIMTTNPAPISTLQPLTPPALDRVVQRCLAKDPDDRWQSAKDLGSELKWVAEAGSQAGVAAPLSVRRRVRSRIAWSLVALLAAVSVFVSIAYYREVSTEVRTLRTTVLAPDGAIFARYGDRAGPVEISPDGRHLAFVAALDGPNMVWIRSLDALEARPLAGTEGAYWPFWSPDSRTIGFFAQGKLKKIQIAGGPALTVCNAPDARGGTWSREDVIVFAAGSVHPLMKVSAAGGEPVQITELDKSKNEETHRFPHFLPDGRHFLYASRSPGGGGEVRRVVVYAGSIDSDLRKSILDTSGNVAYASGYLLFPHGRTLLAQRFDPDRLELIGDAVPIAENLQWDNLFSRAGFSVSPNGILAYQAGGIQAGSDLVWYDRSGNQEGTVSEPAMYSDHSLSPDGTTAVVTISELETGTQDLWMIDLDQGTRTRLTFNDADDAWAAWSPDGARVALASNRRGNWAVFQKPSDGSGESEFIQEIVGGELFAMSWSPDGQHIVCLGLDPAGETGLDLYLLSMSEDPDLAPLVQTPASEQSPQVSPDGRWLAYASNESGERQIYIQPFPLGGGKWQVSSSGGKKPRWGTDSRELFYLDTKNTLMAARLVPGERSLKVGQVEPLFQANFAEFVGWPYDFSSDGQRILAAISREQTGVAAITVVINWTAELER
ncbi:MAG: protein kinase [Acidobacteria bacterium]|nr:protein kinase [Acidobacteriota bacterium]